MSSTTKIRLLALTVLAVAAAGAYQRTTEQSMQSAAEAWLASLNNEQRAKATFEFSNSDQRETWHFVPGNNFAQTYKRPRLGLTFIDMAPEQRHLADTLLASGLSLQGFIKAKTIMSLEDILRIKEADVTGRRDPYKYHFTIFGSPTPDGSWGYRVEGHHLSLHYTLKGGKLISTTPTFFGANPNQIDIGPRKGLMPLGAEGELGFKLVNSLTAEQKKKAIVASEAYSDILTAADTRAQLENQPAGIAASELTADQMKTLMALIEEYASNVPAEIKAARMKAAKDTDVKKMFFAWAGATEPGVGDYYRIQTPTFLIEYDNTQNDANHTHTVWRDYANDFGRDLLALHHRQFDHGLGVNAD